MTRLILAALLFLSAPAVLAQEKEQPKSVTELHCSYCEEWNRPQRPFRIYGDTYYVGPHGLSAILVTSPKGHVLIDGALPQSAPLIRSNIEDLGFRVEDIRLILNSHAHFDHAGAIADLQRASGAEVAGSALSARVLEKGISGPDDPQDGELLAFPAIHRVRTIADGETLRVGPLALTAHFTPGHTAGGTSWSWKSCEGDRCLDIVYADSLTPVSADGFLFSRNEKLVKSFEASHAILEQLPCDVVLAPHPDAAGLWQRLEAREKGEADALIDREGCSRYVASARRLLAKRLESEKEQR